LEPVDSRFAEHVAWARVWSTRVSVVARWLASTHGNQVDLHSPVGTGALGLDAALILTAVEPMGRVSGRTVIGDGEGSCGCARGMSSTAAEIVDAVNVPNGMFTS